MSDVTRALDLLKDWPRIQVEMDPMVAFALIGHLQLALRHPANTGASAEIVRKFIAGLTARLPVELLPLIQRGFDSRYDVAADTVQTKG